MDNNEREMTERIIKYLESHPDTKAEIQARLFPVSEVIKVVTTNGLSRRFEDVLKEHIQNWIPEKPRDKPVIAIIHKNLQNGIYNLSIPKIEEHELEIQDRHRERIKSFKLIKKRFDEFPKYIELGKIPWLSKYFEESFDMILEWEKDETSNEVEKNLIKFRNGCFENG
jgi:hypothetical protein